MSDGRWRVEGEPVEHRGPLLVIHNDTIRREDHALVPGCRCGPALERHAGFGANVHVVPNATLPKAAA